ncbi:WhiB family transcriptional regulator [Streptomyces sp. YIM 98790]|uniref:WhiB family transcriptional regulator n=1 Tax=Streptomyces sp. YIM 98790 TaxID=2689077 RepID=UPI002442607B|nr:WhiB family transcriptional regulator [Streptomyces sp. YIM 98790]
MHESTTGSDDGAVLPLRALADRTWHLEAACRDMDAEQSDAIFFPTPRDLVAITRAKQICARCPVRRTCLEAALDSVSKDGVWGGLTAAERAPLHAEIEHRLDYARIRSVLSGRWVHLSPSERKMIARHAYVRGWSAHRLATVLRLRYKWARDLLRRAEHELTERDRLWGLIEESGAKTATGAKKARSEAKDVPVRGKGTARRLRRALGEAA